MAPMQTTPPQLDGTAQGFDLEQEPLLFVPAAPAVPQSVLIVDEEPATREALEEVLQEICGQRMRLRHCNQGLEALEVLRRRRFDLVLIDYWLPDMDGLELVSTIADMVDDTAVILMARGGDGSLGAEALYRGARHFLDKNRLEPELVREVLLEAWHTARMDWAASCRTASMQHRLEETQQQLQQMSQQVAALLEQTRQMQHAAPAMPPAEMMRQFEQLAQSLQQTQQALGRMQQAASEPV